MKKHRHINWKNVAALLGYTALSAFGMAMMFILFAYAVGIDLLV